MKRTNPFWFLSNRFLEGDGQGAGQGAGQGQGTGQGQGAGQGQQPPSNPAIYTKTDFEKAVNQKLATEREEKVKLVAQLNELKDQANITTEQKSALEAQIAHLESSYKTKEERQAQELKGIETKYQKDMQNLKSEVDIWKGRFTKSMNERALTDAAIEHDGAIPRQFVLMFGSSTELTADVDEKGKPTGSFTPKLTFEGVDPETKKPTMLTLPVSDAIKHMRENGLHPNLFNNKAKSGTGSNGKPGATGNDTSKMPNLEDYPNQEAWASAYHSWRAANPNR